MVQAAFIGKVVVELPDWDWTGDIARILRHFSEGELFGKGGIRDLGRALSYMTTDLVSKPISAFVSIAQGSDCFPANPTNEEVWMKINLPSTYSKCGDVQTERLSSTPAPLLQRMGCDSDPLLQQKRGCEE